MKRVGIKELPYYFFGTDPIDLKRDILMFDKIIIIDEGLKRCRAVAELITKGNSPIYDYNNQVIEALGDSGHLEIVSLSSYLSKNSDTPIVKQFIENTERMDEQKLQDLVSSPYFFSGMCRAMAMFMSKITENNTLPILEDNEFNQKWNQQIEFNNVKSNTLHFVLSGIPDPDHTVSLEQLFDFKNDPDTQKKFYRLMSWVNEVAKGQLTINEIEDKYKELFFEYSERLRIHKMKNNLSNLEIITTIGAQLATLKFDEINKTILSIKRRELNLMEAETSFPGKELAYIHKANALFPNQTPKSPIDKILHFYSHPPAI